MFVVVESIDYLPQLRLFVVVVVSILFHVQIVDKEHHREPMDDRIEYDCLEEVNLVLVLVIVDVLLELIAFV